MSEADFQALNAEVREIWARNADYWNQRMGEGNEFHRTLIAPAQERLLNLRVGDMVLDIGCGNGQFTRRMAELGAHVVALDVSPRMIEHVRANTTDRQDRIEYHVVDATDTAALLAIGERRFDAAVCTMAMMDMASIKLVAEEATSEAGVLQTRYFVAMSEYIHPRAAKGVAMRDQPVVRGSPLLRLDGFSGTRGSSDTSEGDAADGDLIILHPPVRFKTVCCGLGPISSRVPC